MRRGLTLFLQDDLDDFGWRREFSLSGTAGDGETLTLCLAFQSDGMLPAWSPTRASAAVTETRLLSLRPWLGNLTSVTEWTSVIIKLSAFRFYWACNPNHSVRGVTGARLCSWWNLEPLWTVPCGKSWWGSSHTHNTHLSDYLCCGAVSYSYINLTYRALLHNYSVPLRGKVQI